MLRLLRRIRRTGRVAEPAPPRPEPAPAADVLRGGVALRHVDAGSCHGCEIEIGAAFGPVYDAERYGARLTASPRHADALLVTGPVTAAMAQPLADTHAAMPRPCFVVAVGDCARGCGVLADAPGVVGPVDAHVPVDLEVPGCPPRPEAVVDAVRRLTGR